MMVEKSDSGSGDQFRESSEVTESGFRTMTESEMKEVLESINADSSANVLESDSSEIADNQLRALNEFLTNAILKCLCDMEFGLRSDEDDTGGHFVRQAFVMVRPLQGSHGLLYPWYEPQPPIDYNDAIRELGLMRRWVDDVAGIPPNKTPPLGTKAGDAPEPVARSASGSVSLFKPSDQPIVNGDAKKKLTNAQYDVVLALLSAGDKGLTKDDLDRNSGRGDGRGILKRLSKSDSVWESVISFPGAVGKGYRIP